MKQHILEVINDYLIRNDFGHIAYDYIVDRNSNNITLLCHNNNNLTLAKSAYDDLRYTMLTKRIACELLYHELLGTNETASENPQD